MEEKTLHTHREELKKKGKKGLLRLLFSRTGLVALILLANVGLAVYLAGSFGQYYFTAASVLSVVMTLVLLSSRSNAMVKVTWLVLFLVMPVFGTMLYLYTRSDLGHRALQRRVDEVLQDRRPVGEQPDARQRLEQVDPGAAGLSRYLQRCGFGTYQQTDVTYFPSGEAKFQAMLEQLEQARHYIYLEYFIIDKGVMWDSVLDILRRKAAQGLDVRVLYDGTCEMGRLPRGYHRQLAAWGIRSKAFAPLMPFLSTHYNYRDHRKILVIDGQVAFTGGVNLADEYINRVEVYGHWKDAAAMIRGSAVVSFTRLFLEMWCLEGRGNVEPVPAPLPVPLPGTSGFVIPYGDCPLDADMVGERVYMDILNRARRYVHIMTPYLLLDGELETALEYAAQRGVEVVLILPGVPDKKIPYALAKTHYPALMDAGVQIYEYVPGFVHAKVFVCDDREATVGTVNLDYRSLYHHFECGTYLWGTSCIRQMEEDFQDTLKRCRLVTRQGLKKDKWTRRLTGFVLKAISPLL